MNQREKTVCIVVKTNKSTNLEESDEEDAKLKHFTSHVTCDTLSARVACGSPSLDHLVTSRSWVFAHIASHCNREIDKICQVSQCFQI